MPSYKVEFKQKRYGYIIFSSKEKAEEWAEEGEIDGIIANDDHSSVVWTDDEIGHQEVVPYRRDGRLY
tara:strand:- start:11 stop:214 length:204 start_codon:yes stop_codon:yes gene_type:complete